MDDIIEFEVISPDISNEFSGTVINISGKKYIYRPFKVWVDLAEILHCKMLMPKDLGNNRILIRYKPLNVSKSWHNHSGVDISERYGVDSDFSRIFKFEEPYFLSGYIRSLEEITVKKGMKILNLGINRGDEFAVFADFFRPTSDNIFFTGIDHCSSALRLAKKRFSSKNFDFIEEDISKIADLDLEKHDILISVGTLQSPDINGKEIFRYIIQNILKRSGSVILGFPNSRYIDCEVVYGAKTKNYTESNLNLLIKDINFYKRYLQQPDKQLLQIFTQT
ncbi:MAG: methyltransferase domain-containing protein, partial [Candidatus Delongbacteria bacterium]